MHVQTFYLWLMSLHIEHLKYTVFSHPKQTTFKQIIPLSFPSSNTHAHSPFAQRTQSQATFMSPGKPKRPSH